MEIEHFDNMVIEDKFIAIMKNKQVTVIVALAKYVYIYMVCLYVVNQIQPFLNIQINVGVKVQLRVWRGEGSLSRARNGDKSSGRWESMGLNLGLTV